MAKTAVGHAHEVRETVDGFRARLTALGERLRDRIAAAVEEEYAYRRPSLWLPVAAGAGAIFSLTADQEPSLPAAFIAMLLFSALAWLVRARRALFAAAAMLAAIAAGFVAQGVRT